MTKPANSNKRNVAIAVGLLGLVTMFGASGCDTSTDSGTTCECPTGTLHEPGSTCCDGEDCVCKTGRSFAVNGHTVTVEDQTGTIPSERLDLIQSACTLLDSAVLGNTKIIVEPSTAYANVESRSDGSNNIFAIRIDWLSSTTEFNLVVALGNAMGSHSWVRTNAINPTIRLVSTKSQQSQIFAKHITQQVKFNQRIIWQG
jgi:hypothetical protein